MIGETQRPTFREAFAFWFRLGFISFGGPAGQIALLHRETVERRRWIHDEKFSRALAFCTFLPGPEAQQLATWIGWSLHGTRGAITAGVLFVLPASILLLGLSWMRAAWGAVPLVAAILSGLRPVVAAIILDAAWSMARRRLNSRAAQIVAASALVAALVRAPFPAIVAIAGLIGWLMTRVPSSTAAGVLDPDMKASLGWRRERNLILAGVLLWLAPWPLIVTSNDAPFFQSLYLFFTQAAFVTFGGAYAVLSYVTRAAVDHFHWLTRIESLDGLALAETTPGPLIIVLQYVGFLAGWNQAGCGTSRAWCGALAAALTTWATFLPSIWLVLLGARYVERIATAPRLGGVFRSVGAAVTGVIAGLGIEYGLSAVWRGSGTAHLIDPVASALLVVALLALRSGRVPLGVVIASGALVGGAMSLIGPLLID